MSGSGDYHDEMFRSRTIHDDTIEEQLAGNGEDVLLTAFVRDARLAAAGPVPAPSAELASMFSADISSPPLPVEAHSTVTTLRSRRMPIPVILTALPFAAKAALGVGVAAAAVGGAGAAGVLPEPVNNAVANVISTVTPFNLSTSDNSRFGEGVSTDAQDETPGVNGADVSTNAKNLGATPPETPGAPGSAGQPQLPVELPAQASNGASSGGSASDDARPDAVPPVPAPPVDTPVTNGAPAQTPPVSAPPVSAPTRGR
jgi:hypothetical protein